MSGTPAFPFGEIVPLGAGGFFPAAGRQTMSFLLRGDRRALLLDAGTGVARLAEPEIRERLVGVESLDVVLTHYHLDHVVGITYLGAVWGRPVRILGPAPPLTDGTPEEALSRLIAPPLFPATLDRFPMPVRVERYAESFDLEGMEVRARRQIHPGGSAGLRLGDVLAYVTDTAPDDGTVELARGARWLLHEVWVDDRRAAAEPRLVSGHSSPRAVARIAVAAGVERLVPVHHHPMRDRTALAALHDELRSHLRGSSVELSVLEEGVGVPLL